ncbi:MAG: VacJ family lipoprotein [Betaproteobacteria bacterium]|nr:VacJ family lipoprotein [Betaproteobacteria bacterium]
MSAARRWIGAAALGAVLLLPGCASLAAQDPRDPWEGMNRQIYNFNDTLDAVVFKPVAQAYVNLLPSFVRTGAHNFLGNLGDVWTTVNAALQLKGQVALESFMRVTLNSTLGLYGVLDIASEAGIEKRREDLGQTLGHWGVKPGPYVMLPLLGPATLRDVVALPVDLQAGPSAYFTGSHTRLGVTALRLTDTRAGLLKAGDALREAALDPYSFVRDAWLQRREHEVYDGHPPAAFDYTDPDAP